MQMYEDFLALIVAKILEAKKKYIFLNPKKRPTEALFGFLENNFFC